MPLIAFLALLWVAFVILVIAALSGWLVNIIYFFIVVVRALIDVACQAWIDVSKIWERKKHPVELDEYERHIS